MTRNAVCALLAAVAVAGCTTNVTNVYGGDAGAGGGPGSDSGGGGFGLSDGSSLVGEWSTPVPNEPGMTESWYFDSDGNCGIFVRQDTSVTCMTSTCTYTFDGTTLSLTLSFDLTGDSSPSTSESTVAFSRGGAAATLTEPGCDSGPCAISFTRVDFTDNHSCP
ncbi:MAG TPA: hypothetical protein VGG39_13520 [Polyangiaceae bacterium]|jgi:hypothetical protein